VRQIIDTNCLLAFVTDRSPLQNKSIALVFERAANFEEEILVASNVITEFVCMQLSVYLQTESLIAWMVADLLKQTGVHYHHGFLNTLAYER